MSRREEPKSNWLTVKTAIVDLDRDALLVLIRDLYDLSQSNKHFVHARLRLGKDPVSQYKKIIAECMCPDADRNHPVQISRAKKAISEYRKAASDVRGEIDLMIHFVECGNQFTLDYGDIDAQFYDSLLGMYARAVEAVLKLPESQQELFRKRLWELTESSDGIGWGYHDGLCDEYYSAFPDRDA
jgi:hypothetical protein